MTIDASLFTFAYDVVDEGAEAVVQNVAGRAGANGILMAVTYHEGRDIFPHGASARMRHLEPGVTFFRPNEELYRDSPIKPQASRLAADPIAQADPLAQLVTAARKRDVRVHAWTVFLHHDRIGERIEFAPRNAFGDPFMTDLCASNPAARAYARSLAQDVASRGVSSILAEAVQFFPLEHGNHHERYFLSLGPRTRFLMGLCFCDSCLVSARDAGVDGEGLRRWVRQEIEGAFDHDLDDPARELKRDEIASLAGGDLDAYLRMREGVIASLVGELRDAVAPAGVRLTYLEPSGAIKGYATGRPIGAPSSTIAWQLGIDLKRLAAASDDIEILGYAADPNWIAGDIEAYRSALGNGPRMVVAMRPTAPDSVTVENLREKVEMAMRLGVSRLDFYHYGLMRLDALDRIREALAAAGDPARPAEPR
ncbi:MAG TPA: hypothetical protein VNF73_00575 [Candidatus Saccharimonadales bacterium]|nr:hypothetical protein [Candidatus Saccharimonadales bacterium]